ncbi:hypothetical protein MKZ19_21630 [Shouchella clausii]|uniref:hypothetical protein n=1 Tax=Shouchella clausii TaxID=79880 RepID=UPI002DBBFF77|nr:hypothetical protein [Shouchella clausii]MEB5482249.1 hypothetical protein [Shouchella clausii]
MWPFPVVSGILILFSFFMSIRHRKKRESRLPQIVFVLNGVGLLSLMVFLIFFLQNESIITAIPAVVYWLLIAVGVVVGIFSVIAKYVPGHLTSAAILIFCGFITIFSIGVILFVLAIIELLMALFHYKYSKSKLNA